MVPASNGGGASTMKFLLIADPHFRGSDLPDLMNQFLAIEDVAHKVNVDHIMVAGDVFDSSSVGDRNAPTGEIAGAAITAFSRLAKIAPVHIIDGQHDRKSATRVSAIQVLSGIKGVTLYTNPYTMRFGIGAGEAEVIYAPWSYGCMEDDIRQIVDTIGPKTYQKRLLLAHCQVYGASLTKLKAHEEKGTSTLTREFLEEMEFDHLALGDFHRRQEVLEGKGGYIGALRQMDYGEEGNPMGVEVWDSDTDETEWFELTNCRGYRTLPVKPESLTAENIGIMNHSNWHTKLMCNGFRLDPQLIREFEAVNGNKIEEIVEVPERERRAEKAPDDLLFNDTELIAYWNKHQTEPFDAVELKELTDLAKEVLA